MSLPSLDIELLLEFLQSPKNDKTESDISSQLTSLETLATICSDTDAVNCLRNFNGIKLIWNLCCTTNSLDVTHASLFVLANVAQNNIFAQQDLCQAHVFSSLTCLLDSNKTSLKTKTLVTYFLISLVSNNKQGQNFISSCGCLDSLLSMFVQLSKNLNDLKAFQKLEFFKFLAKILTYSVNVPQHIENQEKLIKVMPWIVNGIHSSQRNIEITRLCCELLTVVIEDNKFGQIQAIQCRAVETLILLINSLLPSVNDNCLGSAVATLNHVLSHAESEQFSTFLSFGGCKILQKLVAKSPSEHWVMHHINQTLVLLLSCIENQPEKFDANYLQTTSQSIIKLMKVAPEDDCFHKMSVEFLSLAMDATSTLSKPISKPSANPISDAVFASTSVSLGKESSDFWEKDSVAIDAPKDVMLNLVNNSGSLPYLKPQTFTTIMRNTNADGHEELISKSSKSALRSCSGIDASPTDDVFFHPSAFSVIGRHSDIENSCTRFKKPLLCHQPSRGRPERLNRAFRSIVKPSTMRYSTPKSQKFYGRQRLLAEGKNLLVGKSQTDEKDDVLYVCSELINREVLNSVRKQHGLKKFGTSGLLPRKSHV